jgi:pilus assembly protein Flp/PilA
MSPHGRDLLTWDEPFVNVFVMIGGNILAFNIIHNHSQNNMASGKKEVIKMLFLPRDEGQGLTEYGVVIVLVAVVIVAILTVFGPQVGNMFSRVTTGFAQ